MYNIYVHMYPHFTSCTCSHVDNFKKLPFISERKYRMVKNFGGKKVWRKGCFVRIGEKNWRMSTCIANHQLKIDSKRSNSKL